MKHCSVFGCGLPFHGRGFCSKHLQAFKKWGDPLINKAKPKITNEERTQLRRASKNKYKKSTKGIQSNHRYMSGVGMETKRKYVRKRRERLRMKIASFFKREIKLFYKNTPCGLCVDHIFPLFGDIVSGLHAPWNLQYITIEENLKKGNKI